MKLPAVVSRIIRAAVTPVRASDWFMSVVEGFAGAWQHHIVADSPDDILAYSGPFSCTTLIAGDISKMRLKIVEDQPDGTTKDVPATSPLMKVLQRPNAVQNRIKFIQSWLASKLLHGNAYILIGRDNRFVVSALYVLDPRRVTTLVADDGSVFYRLSADNLSGVRVDVTLPASEIIHDMMVPIFHPLVGVSPIYACGMSATMGRRIVKQSTAFFANGARPGGTLNSPRKIEPEEAAALKREWESGYGGVNAGKTAVLANGLTYSPIDSTPAQDAQLIEQLGWTIEDIARCYHIPLFMLGGAIPANATVETLAQMYYSQCLQVLIEELELCLTHGLALKPGLSVECDLDGLLRMDQAALVKTEAEAVKAGIKKIDESRLRMNLSPVVGGNTPYLQQQNYSLAALAKRDASEDPFGTSKPKPAPVAANDDQVDIAASAPTLMRKHLEVA
jgi:HK97 family phage portal protein